MLCGAVAFGQATSGVISGALLDPQGHALAGATVKIKNLGTGATREALSNSSGYYRMTGLSPAAMKWRWRRRDSPPRNARSGVDGGRGNCGQFQPEDRCSQAGERDGRSQPVNVETTGSTLNGLVDEKKIRDLPLDGGI